MGVVTLDHPRDRLEGRLATFARDGEVVALAAYRCGLTAAPQLPPRLERLDLGDNQLRELPALPASLRELYIHDNRLARLPDLPALRVLDANRNQLAELPPIGGIELVYLAANRLLAIPPVPGVRYLNAGDNPLVAAVVDGPDLVELRLEQAGLRDLVVRAPRLRELALRGNALDALPGSIAALEALEVLDLRGNRLDTLPHAVAALPLRKLDLRWNPMRRPPHWLTDLATRGCNVYM